MGNIVEEAATQLADLIIKHGQQPTEEPPALEQDGDSGLDYKLVGDWCWIMVGNLSVKIAKRDYGIEIEAFDERPEVLDSKGVLYVNY